MNGDPAGKEPVEKRSKMYEIRVQGFLDPAWSGWLECTEFNHRANDTVLNCRIQDQAELHGLLGKIRDMNLVLLSVVLVQSRHDESEVISHEDNK